jgi:excisionase family DNA binding protein
MKALKLLDQAIEMLKIENEELRKENEILRMQFTAFCNKSQAAKYLGVSHTTIKRMIDRGEIKCTNGRISRMDLRRLASQKKSLGAAV